ncbi:MAG: DUF58 domain-containing protein [Planctomycetes bacterium]|nr:DUF58 domain-containing protein [Planctomycetota bacterium]
MLTEDLMKKVRQIEIVTGRAVNEVFAGEYSSAFKGRGMEFAEVRLYQPGDDVRTIDWNVTARTGAPHVKRYVEERELTVVLAVDLSASGLFGSVSRLKSEQAAELCAVLAFAATRSNDKAGLMIFTDRVDHYIPPAKGTHHVLRIVRDVLGFEPAPGHRGTDLPMALSHLSRVLKKRAVVFVVSDFLVPGAALPSKETVNTPSAFETALKLLARRHDVIACSIDDPRERALPRAGLVELEDAETGHRFVLDTSSSAVRKRFEAEALARQERLRTRLRRMGIDHVEVATDRPYVYSLIELFKRREGRR